MSKIYQAHRPPILRQITLLGFLRLIPGGIELFEGAIGHFQAFCGDYLLNLTKTTFELGIGAAQYLLRILAQMTHQD